MSGDTGDSRTTARIEAVVREHWGTILASLTGRLRDLSLAEDVLQDALVQALRRWPHDGIPDHPRAWLMTAARNRAIDLLRKSRRFAERREALVREAHEGAHAPDEETFVDERLSLIFTCCHPALAHPAQVALTLRTLGGLTTTEIARAFLTPETTMAQRLVRAKKKIGAAGIPFGIPDPSLWRERMTAVLDVVYFIFNEGYQASSGRGLQRTDLCDEAIRLGRILVDLSPREPEAVGLLSLMLLHDARREARVADDGGLVTLEEQDRDSWDRSKIERADTLLRAALSMGRVGPYQLQAAVAAVHAFAPSYADTDWRQIVGLYGRLYEIVPSPVVRLNGIVAQSFATDAGTALGELEAMEDAARLERYQPYWATRADLLRRCGRPAEARAAYVRARDLSGNDAERAFMERRIAELGGAPGGD